MCRRYYALIDENFFLLCQAALGLCGSKTASHGARKCLWPPKIERKLHTDTSKRAIKKRDKKTESNEFYFCFDFFACASFAHEDNVNIVRSMHDVDAAAGRSDAFPQIRTAYI